jgi:hypothetical protein
VIWREADARGYHFDLRKLGRVARPVRQPVRAGQLAHEWQHLRAKLRRRDPARWRRERTATPTCHPCFRVVPGGVETWERARPSRV